MDLAEEIELPGMSPARTQAEQLNDAAMHIVEHGGRIALPTASSMLRRALALFDLAEAWSNLGLVLWRLNDLDEAEDCFRRAMFIKPGNAGFHGNLGVFAGALGKMDLARDHLKMAQTLDPDNLGPQWDLCLLELRSGNWPVGLPLYDIRREHRGEQLYPKLPAPFWRGQDLNGKTLYIQAEQGVGDRFLFSRYLSWIKETWPDCKLVACFYDSLINLFWEFRHIVTFLPQGIPWIPDIDYSVYLCSLPEIHGSTVHNIPPDPGFLRERIMLARKTTRCQIPEPILPSLKVGLCWTGNPAQTRNHDRSIPLEMLLGIAEDPRMMVYSFQCGPGQKELTERCAGDLLCDLGPDIEKQGWVGTGLALMEMDLIVTVCTSIPHLAGALQVPCWTMLCADPYWIWSRAGSTTPWYPGMRLFRQRALGDWSPVIAEVQTELTRLADAKLGQINHPLTGV